MYEYGRAVVRDTRANVARRKFILNGPPNRIVVVFVVVVEFVMVKIVMLSTSDNRILSCRTFVQSKVRYVDKGMCVVPA